MSKHWKWYYLFLMVVGILLVMLLWGVKIELIGDKVIYLDYGREYVEKGAKGYAWGREVGVVIDGTVDNKKLGKQVIKYKVKSNWGLLKRAKRVVTVRDTEAPILEMKGDSEIRVRVGEEYMEPGYTMIDNVDGDISDKVMIKGSVNINKAGNYELFYEGVDSSGNKVVQRRLVVVMEGEITYKDEWDKIDNTGRTWWSGNKKDHERPVQGAGATEEELRMYNAYYMGRDEKVIYLTFDEGSNDTYVKEIADVLYKNGVQGTFFLCGEFIKGNPELMKQLVKQGHSVGNHSYHHKAMYKYATREGFDTYVKEIRDVEDTFLKVTGKHIDKVYREPKGEFSLRSLAIVKELGYKSFFYSADYYDFASDATETFALNSFLQRYHNGAIYLMHPKNKGNYLAIDDFVKKMKELGYSFGLVRDIS